MSTLSVTKINTANGSTDLTITTGNTSTGGIVVQSNGNALVLQGNSSVNNLTLFPNGQMLISNGSANTISISSTGAFTTNVVFSGTANITGNVISSGELRSTGFRSTSTPTITGVTTLVSSQAGSFFEIGGGPYTVTLPNPTLSGSMEFRIWLNTSSTITLSTPAGLFYQLGVSGTSTINLSYTQSTYWSVMSDGFNWKVVAVAEKDVNGSFAVSSNTLTLGTSTKAANGYTWLPNGTMLQWFTATVTNTAAQTIAFPTAFPTNCYSLTATPQGAANTMQIGVTIANGTNFTANTITSASKPFYFLAIGA